MTILQVCQQAAIKLNQPQPTSVFSPTTGAAFAAELLLAAQETAESLVEEEHDWRALTQMATCQGDGTTTVFPLSDVAPGYNRVIKDGKVHSLRFKNATFRWAKDLDEWLFIKDNLLVGSPGNVVILNNAIQIFPAMPASDTGRFFYISNLYAISADGTSQAFFQADNDTFALDEKLLRLGIVWRWRSSKRMEYAEDLKNYEIAKDSAIGFDKGNQMIVVGRERVRHGQQIAYPAMLGS